MNSEYRYNKFQDNSNVIDTFTLHNRPYRIRIIPIKYYWGEPLLEDWPEQDFEIDQHPYNTLEEAREFVRLMKRLNVFSLFMELRKND